MESAYKPCSACRKMWVDEAVNSSKHHHRGVLKGSREDNIAPPSEGSLESTGRRSTANARPTGRYLLTVAMIWVRLAEADVSREDVLPRDVENVLAKARLMAAMSWMAVAEA